MEELLKNTTNKLKRLNVDFEINNNSLILRGTSITKGEILLTIILPLIVFFLMITIIAIFLFTSELDKIVIPRAVLVLFILPLVLLYYGIRNYSKLKKSKAFQVQLMPGKIILKKSKSEEIVLPVQKIKKMSISIEQNSSNNIGEIYIQSLDRETFLLLSLIEKNLKYFKDDLEYIRNTFLKIIGSQNKELKNSEY
jgi:hypothetical protein